MQRSAIVRCADFLYPNEFFIALLVELVLLFLVTIISPSLTSYCSTLDHLQCWFARNSVSTVTSYQRTLTLTIRTVLFCYCNIFLICCGSKLWVKRQSSRILLCVGKYLMESSSSPDSIQHCVASNGLTTSDPQATVECLQTEVVALRKELSKKQDLLVKLQDRERQLRERFEWLCRNHACRSQRRSGVCPSAFRNIP